MLMCTDCGEFVAAILEDGQKKPTVETCPDCEGTTFKDVDSDTTLETDES